MKTTMESTLSVCVLILFMHFCSGHSKDLSKPSDYMLVSVKAINAPNGRNNQNVQQSFYEDGIIVQHRGTGFIDDKYKNSQDYGVQSVYTRPVHRQSRSSSKLYNYATPSLDGTKRSPPTNTNPYNSFIFPVNYAKTKPKPSRDQQMSDSSYILVIN